MEQIDITHIDSMTKKTKGKEKMGKFGKKGISVWM